MVRERRVYVELFSEQEIHVPLVNSFYGHRPSQNSDIKAQRPVGYPSSRTSPKDPFRAEVPSRKAFP